MRLQYLAGMSLNSYVRDRLLAGIPATNSFPENNITGSDQRPHALKVLLKHPQPGGPANRHGSELTGNRSNRPARSTVFKNSNSPLRKLFCY